MNNRAARDTVDKYNIVCTISPPPINYACFNLQGYVFVLTFGLFGN